MAPEEEVMTKSVEIVVSEKQAGKVQRKLEKFAGAPPVVMTEERQPGVLYLVYKAIPHLGKFMQELVQNRFDNYRIIAE